MPLNEKLSKYATKESVTIHYQQTVEDAIFQMIKHRFRRFPVVNDDNEPIGMLTSSDILTVLNKHSGVIYLEEIIGDIMTKDLITIDGDQPVRNAISLMYNSGISGIPITDDQGITGIFTMKDVIVFDDLWKEISDDEISSEDGIGRPISSETIVFPDDGFWEITELLHKIPQREILIKDNASQAFLGMLTNMNILKVIYTLLTSDKENIDKDLGTISVGDMEARKLFHKALPTVVSSCRLWMNTRGVEAFPLLYRSKPVKLITEKDLFGYLAMNLN